MSNQNLPARTRTRTISSTEIFDDQNLPTRTRKRTISTTEVLDQKLSDAIRRLSAPFNILVEDIPIKDSVQIGDQKIQVHRTFLFNVILYYTLSHKSIPHIINI